MSPETSHIPELLAPAGGPASLRAAVANGADAVYLGVDRFNARRSAENFTLDSLRDACRFAHLRGVRVYLTLNVVILPAEMSAAVDVVDSAWAAGVDAVIVQDLGLLRCLRTTLPHVRVHASTQMNTHASSSVAALSRRGVSRVTLAREVSIAEIGAMAAMAAREGVEIESFVHGALCVSYSGQCLLSSLIGGRSANRGRCAQPCRLPYGLVDEQGEPAEVPGQYLLSPQDLAGISVLPGLVGTGVAALKIEGRMKSAEYVALVTGVYRSALDRAAALPHGFEVRDSELAVLSEAFSRGLSAAYLVGERGNAMMSFRRPNNRGVLIGRIESVAGARATVRLEKALENDDTIEVWTSGGRFTQQVGGMQVDGSRAVSAPGGGRVDIALEGIARTGDRVFRVRNAALAAAAARTFSESSAASLIGVDFEVRVVIGEAACVSVRDGQGRSGIAEGAVVEAARTRAVSAEEIREHVGRLGGSGYVAGDYDITLSPDVGIAFSELHRLRRLALEALETRILEPWRERAKTGAAVKEERRRPVPARTSIRIVVAVADLDAAHACLAAGADEACLDARLHDGVWPADVTPFLGRIVRDDEEQDVLARASRCGRAVAGTIGSLRQASAHGLEVAAHWSLNAMNAHAVAELRELGASFVWLSPELSARQVAEVAGRASLPVGVAVAGRQELMVTEHCVLMAEGECSRECRSCARRSERRWLEDRKGYRFPMATDPSGRTHIYNAVPLDLLASLDEVVATGVDALRLDLETSSEAEAVATVRAARCALDGTAAGASAAQGRPGARPTTTGHFFRGVD